MSKPKSRSRSSRRPSPRWRAARKCRRAQLPSEECMRTVISIAVVAMACRGPAPAAAQDHTLRVPTGFKIAVFAQNLEGVRYLALGPGNAVYATQPRSEEHTSELQSQSNLVCRLLLEKKKNKTT